MSFGGEQVLMALNHPTLNDFALSHKPDCCAKMRQSKNRNDRSQNPLLSRQSFEWDFHYGHVATEKVMV
jgi:hypothetical protein